MTKRQKVKRHCGRFWLWYLIGVIIFLAIFLPIFFKVIIPAIIDDLIKKQGLPINSGAIRVVSPTQLNMTMSTSLDTPLPASIDPLTLDLFNRNTTDYSPFVHLELPASSVNGKTEITVTNQTCQVSNETELARWFNDFFDKKILDLSVAGKSKIHLGALEYDAEIDTTIETPGLNYLEGFGLVNMDFLMPPDENGHNVKGALNIPNAGTLALGLGNLTFNMLLGEVHLGLVNIYDVELSPGNNSIDFDGNFFFAQLVPNLAAILDSQKEALGEGYVEILASGNRSTVNGETIGYIEQVLNSKRVPIRVPVITLLADIFGGLLHSVSGGGSSNSSLIDVFGEAVGNATLFEQLLSHWEPPETEGDGSRRRKKSKRGLFGGSLMWKLLKLSLQTKRGR